MLLQAKDLIIYEIAHSIPMGDAPTVSNYYVNLGEQDGINPGVVLDVYRKMAVQNGHGPALYHLKVKVGELEVIWTDRKNSISVLREWKNEKLLLDVSTPMIGDNVMASVVF